jgi:hypothetical protein
MGEAPAYFDEAGALTDGDAMVALNSTTVTGSVASSIAFRSGYNNAGANVGGIQSWSQYMDLMLICYTRSDRSSSNDDLKCTFNSDTGTNYDQQSAYGTGSGVDGGVLNDQSRTFLGSQFAASNTANRFAGCVVTLCDVNSGKNKFMLSEDFKGDNSNSQFVMLAANTWRSQEPITRIDLYSNSGNFVVGSRIDIFGLLPRMVMV